MKTLGTLQHYLTLLRRFFLLLRRILRIILQVLLMFHLRFNIRSFAVFVLTNVWAAKSPILLLLNNVLGQATVASPTVWLHLTHNATFVAPNLHVSLIIYVFAGRIRTFPLVKLLTVPATTAIPTCFYMETYSFLQMFCWNHWRRRRRCQWLRSRGLLGSLRYWWHIFCLLLSDYSERNFGSVCNFLASEASRDKIYIWAHFILSLALRTLPLSSLCTRLNLSLMRRSIDSSDFNIVRLVSVALWTVLAFWYLDFISGANPTWIHNVTLFCVTWSRN